jgi:hypothetical protein
MLPFKCLILLTGSIIAVQGWQDCFYCIYVEGLINIGEPSLTSIIQSNTPSPEIGAAPSLTPTFRDPKAPNPQDCPGYKATNVKRDLKGVTADLTIAGPNCQALYVF